METSGADAAPSRGDSAHNWYMASWDDVARIVAGLALTSEPAQHEWRVGKKLMAWERPLRTSDREALGSAAPDGDILGVRVSDEGVKFALIADEPRVYFTTPHFDGYPAVLVKLGAIAVEDLEDVLFAVLAEIGVFVIELRVGLAGIRAYLQVLAFVFELDAFAGARA